jgi:hypothetical protein
MNKNFSVGKLCKQSASQILFLSNRPPQVVATPEQIAGIKYQSQVSLSKYKEMCGNSSISGKTLYYSWDEVQVKSGGILRFIEHKKVAGDYQNWYLNNSLLQTAIYAAFTLKTRRLNTAKFYSALGNPVYTIDTRGASRKFFLKFGNETYRVSVTNTDKIRKFMKNKIKSLENYTLAKEFDSIWKHKEFELLSDCFTYTKTRIT